MQSNTHTHKASSTPSFRACSQCGRPIPNLRLSAVPHAQRCVACQAEHDVYLNANHTVWTGASMLENALAIGSGFDPSEFQELTGREV